MDQELDLEVAKLLDKMMKSRKKISNEQIIVTSSNVVQRQSTDILAMLDEDVKLAIKYIKDNSNNIIFIKDVVDAVGIGRKALQKKFKDAIHRSIYSEIQQIRSESISKMLIETNLSISQIASLFNFTDVEHISRFFKKEKGIGMREFRKIHKPR